MAITHFIALPHRSLFSVSGEDRKTFLQGLVSADVFQTEKGRALYGAFLTPQGKFLHEFFLAEGPDQFLLETEASRRADFIKRLSLYKLRSKVTLAAADHLQAYALIGPDAAAAVGLAAEGAQAGVFAGGLVFIDPRLPSAGVRAWLPEGGDVALEANGLTRKDQDTWEAHRIGLGLPDGSRDMVPEKAILLENGFDELLGVDWQKGCYLGQELTARTKYRGLIKKRLMPVAIDGSAPEPGALIRFGDAEAGEMRSHSGNVGLALIRLEAFAQWSETGGTFTAGDAVLTPRKPDWAVF
jgi:hypothetical protein